MSSARERLLGSLNRDSDAEMRRQDGIDAEEDRSQVKIGARMAKHQIAFEPAYEGGISLEYHLLQFSTYRTDWTEITLYFVTHTVVIRGVALKGLLDQIKAHVIDLVTVARPPDPLHAAAGMGSEKPRFDVRSIMVEAVEG